MSVSEPLLSIDDLNVDYRVKRNGRVGVLRAVTGVSFDVAAAETVGIVGESGSGKSTVGKAVLGLEPAAAGRICFAGEDITEASGRRRRELSQEIQVVFQDPYSSLNPARSIGQTMSETLWGRGLPRSAIAAAVERSLTDVGLSAEAAERYPSQFSGGQRQRIAIARALVSEPRLIICDEPVSALDLSVQAQVLNLLLDIQQSRSVALVFISHDINVIRHVCHRVVVMNKGAVVEQGDVMDVTERPQDPYTRRLLAAVPKADPRERLQGAVKVTGA